MLVEGTATVLGGTGSSTYNVIGTATVQSQSSGAGDVINAAVGSGLTVVATTALSALSASADSFGASVSRGLGYLLLAGSLVINAAIFTLALRVSTARRLPVRVVWRGALIAAVAWQALQVFGTFVIGHEVKRATELNGLFAIVLGLIAGFYIEALIVVIAVEYNAVRELKLYPRALLTPFTDNVSLTKADEAAYRGQAIAQRAKGFQDIDVTFEPHGHDPDLPA